MFSFTANNVHAAVHGGLQHLLVFGVEESSRNGKVLVAPGPVCTVYTNPMSRVVLSPTRDANPFFHFFESLWMLNGDNTLTVPAYFNAGYRQFSDDDKTMWDAYGWRWRSFFGWDQLPAIAEELRRDPLTRRAVLTMWNAADFTVNERMYIDEPAEDDTYQGVDRNNDFTVATNGGKAVPCNTQAYFDVRGGRLNMTVTCRSNDAIWGAYGANVVHFSFLLEYMARQVGVPVGVYRQFSNNFHVYVERFDRDHLRSIADECYGLAHGVQCPPMPLDGKFDAELKDFMAWTKSAIQAAKDGERLTAEGTMYLWKSAFLSGVATPMLVSYAAHKNKMPDAARFSANMILADDWRVACLEWLNRRRK